MAGIGHRGFMGRKRGDDFRYLHDEISGGLFAFSHLKTRSAYAGDSVVVGGRSYGFVDNIMDLGSIDSDFGSNTLVNEIKDQFGVNHLNSGIAFWDKSENDLLQCDGVNGKFKSVTTGTLSTHAGAFTIVTVARHTAASYQAQEYLYSGNSLNGVRFYYLGSARFLFRIGTSPRIDCDNVAVTFDNNIHILFGVYDGSEDVSGINVYEDDVTTALAATKSETGSYLNQANFSGRNTIGLGGSASNTDFQGLVMETHIFDHALNVTERQTVKDILSQYYTFL